MNYLLWRYCTSQRTFLDCQKKPEIFIVNSIWIKKKQNKYTHVHNSTNMRWCLHAVKTSKFWRTAWLQTLGQKPSSTFVWMLNDFVKCYSLRFLILFSLYFVTPVIEVGMRENNKKQTQWNHVSRVVYSSFTYCVIFVQKIFGVFNRIFFFNFSCAAIFFLISNAAKHKYMHPFLFFFW